MLDSHDYPPFPYTIHIEMIRAHESPLFHNVNILSLPLSATCPYKVQIYRTDGSFTELLSTELKLTEVYWTVTSK